MYYSNAMQCKLHWIVQCTDCIYNWVGIFCTTAVNALHYQISNMYLCSLPLMWGAPLSCPNMYICNGKCTSFINSSNTDALNFLHFQIFQVYLLECSISCAVTGRYTQEDSFVREEDFFSSHITGHKLDFLVIIKLHICLGVGNKYTTQQIYIM